MIQKDNRRSYLGRFHTAEAATDCYNQAARQLYGETAYQNQIVQL